MTVRTSLDGLVGWLTRDDEQVLRSLHSAEQLRKILDRERTRADRAGSTLTLLRTPSTGYVRSAVRRRSRSDR